MPALEVRRGSVQEVLSDAEVLFDWKFMQEEFGLRGHGPGSDKCMVAMPVGRRMG
jgi:hypothetical protein